MPQLDGPQFNRQLTPMELTKPVNNFTATKSARDLEWSMSDNGGISTADKWEKGLTDNSLKGKQGYLNTPGPNLRDQG